jgi:hypothetical protein
MPSSSVVFLRKISYTLAFASVIACIHVKSAFALSTTEVEKIAQSISVQIKGQASGSGVIDLLQIRF